MRRNWEMKVLRMAQVNDGMGESVMETYEEKCRKLHRMLEEYAKESVAVAFSGGVDSSLLLKLAMEHTKDGNVYAVTMQTRLHPVREIESARRTAEEIGAKHLVVPVDELAEAGIADNPKDRCYRCKRCLFEKLRSRAEELGTGIVMDGTIEDDLHVYRPGVRALKEMDVKSPLAEAGFCKEDVRRLAAEYGLSAADRPASPCLATRFPYGTALTYESLGRVERGEDYLKSLGLYNVRLRVHGDIARIETDRKDFGKITLHGEAIAGYMKELGYSYVTLDLEGFRSGSMDIHIMDSK